jgi:hypothetical protein
LRESSNNGKKKDCYLDISIFWDYSTKNMPDNRFFQKKPGIPKNQKTGRKPLPIDPETEELIFSSYHINKLSPVFLENKIEESHGIHIPHKDLSCASVPWSG